jgi:ferredoxin
MGHVTSAGVYGRLRRKLDRHVVGMPDSPLALAILRHLFGPDEAELASRLPLKFEPVHRLSRRLGIEERELDERLMRMAERALVFDIEKKGTRHYMLAPTVVGLFEFSMMRVRDDIDQKAVAELLDRYLTGDDAFARQAFEGSTQIGRALVDETVLEDHARILDYESATAVVRDAGRHAVGLCYCRHLRSHLGKSCDAPLEVCMSLGLGADYAIRHGHAREVDVAEALDILARTSELGLVHIGDNVQRRLAYICSCCGCCCEMLGAIGSLHLAGAVVSSRWLPEPDETCKGCGRCARACPIGAISLEGRGGGRPLRAVVDAETCIGCGVCVRRCRTGASSMVERDERVFVPETTAKRVALMALERGKLADFLLDADGPLPVRSLTALLSTLSSLPPVKRRMAESQLASRFVDVMLDGMRSPRMRWLSRL